MKAAVKTKLDTGRKSLEEMLKVIGIYLPQPDAMPVPEDRPWTTSEDCGHLDGKKSTPEKEVLSVY